MTMSECLRRSSRTATWLALGCALVLAACSHKPKVESAPPPPKPPTEPLAWVPDDANVVGRVALEPFRKTEMWAMWSELQRDNQPFMSFIDLALVEEVTLGGKLEGQQPDSTAQASSEGLPSARRPSFVSVIRGRFGADYLAKLAVKHQLTAQQRGLLTVYARPQEQWAQLSPELLLVFSADRADAVVARAGQGDGVALRKTALYQSLAARLAFETADLALIAEDTSGAGRQMLREQGAPSSLGALADDVTRAGISVDVGPEVGVAAVAETPDGAQAQELQQRVTRTLDALARNLIVGILGLRPVISALKTSNEQNFVTVRGNIPQADLTPALRKLSTMLQMASAASGQQPDSQP